jgi:hypothetical protein
LTPTARGAVRLATALAVGLSGCAAPGPTAVEERIAEARRAHEDDAAIEARILEVQAAALREQREAAIDDFQVRVGDRNDGDNTLRVLTRVPVPNPMELGAQRAVRRAETRESLARLDETALERMAEDCFRALEVGAHRERESLYELYARRDQELLDWNEEWRRSGRLNEGRATRFEIERRVRLAERIPEPVPPGVEASAPLPGVDAQAEPLDLHAERVRELVRQRHPSLAVHGAESERFGALSERAERRRLPWFDFVDFGYEVKQRRPDEIGGQVAVRVPLGFSARADAGRYRALRDARLREGDRFVEEQVWLGRQALAEIDWFESNAPRWRELAELAARADAVAERWQRQRLATPSDVATLFDRSYDARSSVLEARARAGLAGCRLLATTGVPAADWPRSKAAKRARSEPQASEGGPPPGRP